MTLTVKDASGVSQNIKTTLSGSDHVPSHNVDNFPASQDVIVISALPTGTNSIGIVSISGTVTISGAVDINTIAAGDNNIGNVDIATMPAITGTVTSNLEKSSSASVTSVNDSASNVSLLGSTPTRKMASFFNDSTELAYLKCGTTASLTSFTVKIFPNGYFELPLPIYTGAIDCIWANDGSGAMRITEYL